MPVLNQKGFTVQVNKLIGSGSAPTAAAGTGAGTSPTITVAGNDLCGTITVVAGATPAGSNAIIATITFASTFGVTPVVDVAPANANAAALSGTTGVFVDSAGTTAAQWVLRSGSAGLTGATTYVWSYRATG